MRATEPPWRSATECRHLKEPGLVVEIRSWGTWHQFADGTSGPRFACRYTRSTIAFPAGSVMVEEGPEGLVTMRSPGDVAESAPLPRPPHTWSDETFILPLFWGRHLHRRARASGAGEAGLEPSTLWVTCHFWHHLLRTCGGLHSHPTDPVGHTEHQKHPSTHKHLSTNI